MDDDDTSMPENEDEEFGIKHESDDEHPQPQEDAAPKDSLEYYNSLVPEKHICPFSNPVRRNPCQVLKYQGKIRKETIAEHLHRVRDDNYDIHHPANDPLWNSALITDYYFRNKSDYMGQAAEEERRKVLKAESNLRHYRKRQQRQELADEKYAQWKRGEIDFREYRRHLLGGKWNKATLEKMQDDKEKEVEARFQGRIRELESKIKELEQANRLGEDLKGKGSSAKVEKELANIYNVVPRWFGTPTTTFLEQPVPHSLLALNGWDYPQETHPTTYYYYAALTIPMRDWTRVRPWSDKIYRRVAQRVENFICQRTLRNLNDPKIPKEQEQNKLNEARVHRINETLVSSWRQIIGHPEYKEPEEFSDWILDAWDRQQELLWKEAQRKVRDKFLSMLAGSSSAVVEMASYIDTWADLATNLAKEEAAVREANREIRVDVNMDTVIDLT